MWLPYSAVREQTYRRCLTQVIYDNQRKNKTNKTLSVVVVVVVVVVVAVFVVVPCI